MVHVTQFCWQLAGRIRTDLQFRPDPARKLSANLYDIKLLGVKWKTPDDGQRNCPKHVEFYSKNKFEALFHLVGFIIRIYHNARSPESQIGAQRFFYVYLFLSTSIRFGHVSTLHTWQSSTQNNKYQVSHKHRWFCWWWAHSRTKLQRLINIVRRSCATSWFYLTFRWPCIAINSYTKTNQIH